MWARLIRELITLSYEEQTRGLKRTRGWCECYFFKTEVDLSRWRLMSMLGRVPSSDGYSIVYCRSSVNKLRKLGIHPRGVFKVQYGCFHMELTVNEARFYKR